MISFDQLDQLIAWTDSRPPAAIPSSSQLASMRQKATDALVNNPLLQQYARHIGRAVDHPGETHGSRNQLPWHAVGELLYARLLLLHVGDGPDDIALVPGLHGASPALVGISTSMILAAAQPYLWSDAIEHLAAQAPMPPCVVTRSLLAYPMMFWSREVAYGSGKGFETNWMAVFYAKSGIRIFIDRLNLDTQKMQICMMELPFDARFPGDFKEGLERESAQRLLQKLAFIASPYVDTPQHPIPRPERRRMIAAGVARAIVEQTIHTVQLRREVQRPGREPALDSPDWKHHWWVSGHYRAQWYPSLNEHKVIWIAPHVKGPLEKPLLEKVYAVVR